MRALLLLAGLLLAVAVQAQVYRSVDENGVVTYSDRPAEGAEPIELREAQTYSAPAVQRPQPRQEESEDAASRYESLEIASPAQEEVLWNIGGELAVTVRPQPGLQAGHRIRVSLDGRAPVELPPGRTQARFSEVFRGSHSLQAAVVTETGNTLIQSDTVNFVVRQNSVQNPVNPNNPRRPSAP